MARSPHPGVRQPPVTAVESAAVLVESQHAVPEESRTGVPWACMPRTVFTGRDLTQIVGRVEAQGLVGTSPDELGAGLPYG